MILEQHFSAFVRLFHFRTRYIFNNCHWNQIEHQREYKVQSEKTNLWPHIAKFIQARWVTYSNLLCEHEVINYIQIIDEINYSIYLWNFGIVILNFYFIFNLIFIVRRRWIFFIETAQYKFQFVYLLSIDWIKSNKQN